MAGHILSEQVPKALSADPARPEAAALPLPQPP